MVELKERLGTWSGERRRTEAGRIWRGEQENESLAMSGGSGISGVGAPGKLGLVHGSIPTLASVGPAEKAGVEEGRLWGDSVASQLSFFQLYHT